MVIMMCLNLYSKKEKKWTFLIVERLSKAVFGGCLCYWYTAERCLDTHCLTAWFYRSFPKTLFKSYRGQWYESITVGWFSLIFSESPTNILQASAGLFSCDSVSAPCSPATSLSGKHLPPKDSLKISFLLPLPYYICWPLRCFVFPYN